MGAKRRGLVVLGVLLSAVPCALPTAHAGGTPATPLQEPPDPRPAKSYIPYAEGRSLFQLLRPELLPADLRALDQSTRPSRWSGWVERHDADIRARLDRGEEDTVVNLLFFGTRFSTERRLRYVEIPALPDDPEQSTVVRRRTDDLIGALARGPTDERMRFVHDVLTRAGIDPGTPRGRDRARDYLRTITRRAINDARRYDDAAAAAKRLDDAVASNIGYATLYRERGLSSDASFLPDYALHETLKRLVEQRWLAPASVRRAAIIGPGLDLADKRGGYDLFPVQTFQPFAVIDSMFGLGLAHVLGLQMTTLDVNPRIVRHLDAARARARMGQEYVIRLLRDRSESWTPQLADYWERFGTAIGTPAPESAPGLAETLVRSVHVRPDVVLRIAPRDLNVVVERLDLAPDERFDLVVATNVLTYYDVFEQSLALANIARMLRPGGLLLSNDFVLPNESMLTGGYADVPYGGTEGDRIFWYQRQ